MHKIWITLMLIVALCIGSCARAEIQQEEQVPNPVPRAASLIDLSPFRQRLSFTLDDETGEWSAGADAFEAVLDQAKRGDISSAMIMQLKWMGNERTGIVQPLLELYCIGSDAISASAISIRVGDVRYDLQVKIDDVKVGARRAERLWAPLTKESMTLLDALANADAYSIRLHGKRTRSTDVKRNQVGSNARNKLEAASFDCFMVGSEMDMTGYGLWDLNIATWKAAYGFEPRVDIMALTENKGFGMLSHGDSGQKVKALCQQLIERQFLAGNADSSYGERLREAVLRAQKHFDLVQTGSADSRLMELLSDVSVTKVTEPARDPAMLELGSTSIRLDRFWFANTVRPSKPSADHRQGHEAGNLDNVLAVFEGVIQNNDIAVLSLDWQIKGTLYLDGYPYGCAFYYERDRGSAFDTQLLPQAKSRLIVVAEIPQTARLAQEVKLTIEQSDQTLVFLEGS